MQNKGKPVNTVDEYIDQFPNEVQTILRRVRDAIKQAAPNSIERISYQMHAYSQNRILVYFAGYKKHIGFYPGAKAVIAFKKELTSYKGAKGSIQFPIDRSMPLGLIRKIVSYRVKEDTIAILKATKRPKLNKG
jgi:uncharacterized protein YdhG (YjbR/CyaY superfamily)